MTEKIVINTSPLLAISKMQAFDSIGRLPFEFICPAEVENEILIGAKQGYDVRIPEWVKIENLRFPISSLAVASLDAGEAAVIQLALEQNIEMVCIDELKGRRAAVAVGLRVVGSLGLLGKAKTNGLITEVKPFLEKAIQAGIYYEEKLIENFLQSLGE
jgi:predicted nucleic acid-binding protein